MSATTVMLPEVEVAELSDPGKDPDKQVNEDTCRFGQTQFGQLLVLCDGMGGHDAGREASTGAVETVFKYVHTAAPRPDIPPPERAREVLRDAVALANREVRTLGDPASHTRPGSTLVAVLVHAQGAEVAHVGDSRAYLVHEGQIRQLTRDHSMVQELVDAGALSPSEAAGHPESNKITRALGMADTVDVEIAPESVVFASGDTFIVCSDGLSDLVGGLEIQEAVTSLPLAEAAAKLVAQANERGGHDNITVAMMRPKKSSFAPAAVPSEPIAFRNTEPMAAVPEAALAPVVKSSYPPPPAAADSHPLLPPAPPASRRTTKPGMTRGARLTLVGVGGAALIVALALAFHFAGSGDEDGTGSSLPIVFPGASLQHGGQPPETDADAAADGGRGHHLKKKTHK